MSKISKGDIENAIKKLVHEYTGTGASGGNAGDGNNITSPRPFADDAEEIENYIFKNIYGGELLQNQLHNQNIFCEYYN